MKGKLYLIPVTLGNEDYEAVIPSGVLAITRGLRHFVVEDLRSARRYLRLIDKQFPIDDSHFTELNEHTSDKDLPGLLSPLLNGSDVGIISEAGLPAIADPGARLVAIAHKNGIKVVPLSGPSSIILGLIASGLNGQSFTFNGYLPVKPPERVARLHELERKADEGIAQIFMETPYRAQKMLESVLEICKDGRMLCIAADITLPSESVVTRSISGWRKNIPDLKDKLVVFIMQ